MMAVNDFEQCVHQLLSSQFSKEIELIEIKRRLVELEKEFVIKLNESLISNYALPKIIDNWCEKEIITFELLGLGDI